MYTRVLRGNLDYERLVFPANKRFTQTHIDLLARRHLWSIGEDYCHGTGHGVGHFLNVHEGPYGKQLKAGHTWTDEPGFYKDGEFGIRIENLLIL
jgi:Xaa-Pro aminopeptidase